ncbi:ATP-binding cassette domain-containing protein [Dermabacter hominis]|uniref:ABC-F family ATP-binding cassette domain-containing protein n=1 Tax=Dermabacter hominis TaxID=36740 RepID=UPI0021A5DD8A|nr:ABC-F family ATP-binding cassette domain-containing protein [Dermabacter hominis]MCT1955291.1 ATP-binding cassette domain-containing protein [Dermabacter hominis]
MPALVFDAVSFSFTSRPLLERVSFRLGAGERACLVGPNGCGKTTLLRLALGELSPEGGAVTWEGMGSDACQPPSAENFTGRVSEYFDRALAPVRALSVRFEQVTAHMAQAAGESSGDVREYDALLAEMTARDVWSLESRIDEVLAGLGLAMLAGEGRAREVATLSPGQRGRLPLAAVLIAKPEVLVLDEPTNHLDAKAVAFLADTIRAWEGPVLMTSHDRAFIDETATAIYDLDVATWQALATAEGHDLHGVYRTSGSYSMFLEAKHKARETHAQIHAAQQSEKREIGEHRHAAGAIASGGVRLAEASGMAKKFFADRAQATSTRRKRSDDRRLEALEEREVRRPRSYNLTFPLAPANHAPGLALSAREATVHGRLAPLTLDLSRGEHLLVTGGNGAGKTTFLNWIASGAPPEEAEASGSISSDRPVGFVPQRLPHIGDPGFTRDVWIKGVGERGAGMLHPSMWHTRIEELSAGNQRRAQLALALAEAPSFLVIDEPTNFLDLATVEALERAFSEWSGTLIIASHDRWLIEHWAGRRLNLAPAPVFGAAG